jgi:hypothetical protein
VPRVPKDQATETFVEGRLKDIGGALDEKIDAYKAAAKTEAANLAAKALAAAKEDAAGSCPASSRRPEKTPSNVSQTRPRRYLQP